MPDNTIDNLAQAGFTQNEIQNHAINIASDLAKAGFSSDEIQQYANIKQIDTNPIKEYWNGVATFIKGSGNTDYANDPSKFFQHYYSQGLGKSLPAVINAYNNGTGLPEAFNQPQDGGVAGKIIEGLGTITGDLPSYAATAFAAGKAAPGGIVGKLGTTFATGAITPAIKSMYIDALQKGQTNNFLDWYRSFIDVGIKTGIEEGTKLTVSLAAPGIVGATGIASRAIAGAVGYEGAGAVFNGHLPTAEDFAASVGMFGLLGLGETAVGKSLNIIKKEDITLPDIADQSIKDPTIKQDLASTNKDIPTEYQTPADKKTIEDAGKSEIDPIKEIENLQLELNKAKEEVAQKTMDKAGIESIDTSLNKVSELEKQLAEKSKDVIPPERSADPDVAKVQEKITSTPVVKNPTIKQYADLFYTHIFDRLHPIYLAVKKVNENGIAFTKGGKLDPYENARSQPGMIQTAMNFILHSPIKFKDLSNVGMAFDKIIEPIKNDVKARAELDAYLVAKRSLEKAKQGFETGIDQKAAKSTVDKLKSKYEDYAVKLGEYQDHVLNYLIDSGMLSAEKAKAFREANKDYTPFHRLIEDNNTGKYSGSGNSIKKFKGSTKDIISPLESIVKNTLTLIPLAERNKAFVEFIKMVEDNKQLFPEINKVKSKTSVTNVSKDEIATAVNNPESITADSLQIFRKNSQLASASEIAIYRDGKREVWEVGKDLAKALKPLEGSNNPVLKAFLNVFSKASTGVRIGSTLVPNFFIKNLLRDTFDATIYSNSGFKIVLDSYKGFLNAIDGVRGIPNKVYENWLKSSGTQATFVSWDRDYFKNEWKDFSNENVKWYNKISNGWEMLKIISEISENATRMGEFKKAYDKAKEMGLSERDAIRRAGFEARNVTLDFQRMGASIAAWNKISAFFNAGLQGMDKFYQQLADPATRGSTLLKAMTYITLPSALLWWVNKDDEKYKSLPLIQKDLNWIFIVGDNVYRVPKPTLIGPLMGTGIERLLDFWHKKDPGAVEAYLKDFFGQQIANNFVPYPDALKPWIQRKFNYNLFTEQPFIPANLEKVLPEYQYTQYTSETAKVIGKGIRSILGDETNMGSPIQIDSAIQDWSGGMGKMLVFLTDQALIKSGTIKDPIKPSMTLADIPVIQAFIVRNPTMSSEYITRFNDEYDKVKIRIDTVKSLEQHGDFVSAKREADKIPVNQIFLDNVHEALVNNNIAIQNIYNNKQFTADEKRQMIDDIYRQSILISKSALTKLNIKN